MDIFQTISTGATIIYKFIDSYASASDQWRSLATRLKWDLRVISQFTQYYEKCIKGDGSLSPEHAELLVNSVPFPVTSKCPVLKSLITRTQGRVRLPANHSLSERYGLAQSLATAVFFLHSVGFLHHNVTSHNVLMLYRLGAPSQKQFPYSLGTPFLVGFDAVKEFHALSDQRETSDPDILYQHPDRLLETGRPKYGPEHDIYSLGMVMLEVGIWRPLERYTAGLLDLEKRGTTISELIRLVDVSMGARFRKVVEWCLSLETSSQVDPIRLSREVLEPLEEMASSLR